MTRLSEAYEPDAEFQVSLRRVYLGVGLFLVGAVLVVAGIVAATTRLLVGPEASIYAARELGGTLAGLGVPAVFLGVFAVLPASRRTQGAAVIGASVAVLGVAVFRYAYPCRWSGANCAAGLTNLTLPTAAVYFSGAIVTFWCLFVGVANFKSRNDPQGTVEMEVTRKGETKVIEVPAAEAERFGGVGLLGDTPEGDVATQTAAGPEPGPASDGGPRSTRDVRDVSPAASRSSDSEAGPPPGPDSGSAARSASEIDRVGGVEPTNPGRPGPGSKPTGRAPGSRSESHDQYCGSCRHFRYVRTESGMRPYCGAHREEMDDMDACEDWTPRSQD
ncbi:MAG: ribonuclease BN [Halolamina sp.]